MTTDVAIIGGAAIGSAVASFLKAELGFTGRVVVVERDPSYRDCSTTRSAASIRTQFSTAVNIALSRFGFDYLRRADETLAVDGELPPINLVERGYLYLATPAGLQILRANHAVQLAAGAAVSLLTAAALAERFPWLNVDDLAGGAYGEKQEGWFDAYALLHAFRRKARAHGAEYVHGQVVGLERHGDRVTALSLADGSRIAAGAVVNAAGPRAAEVAAMAGIDLPVRPRKRFVFTFESREAPAGVPMVIDPSGVYVRPEGQQFICGTSPPPDRDPDCMDFEIDHTVFEDEIWPALAHRIPAFEALKPLRAWAGHYAMSTLDCNAILGLHPEVANLYFANGFSGHGIQQAAGVGRAIAEMIATGASRSIDVSPLGWARVLEGRPLAERNVI
ncbi:MAG: FAD-binding oxidoreductase [Rhodospirillaceae bacterium]|nr:FAD-binding oxidoreductase [Rhodospirillaceae bacterium]